MNRKGGRYVALADQAHPRHHQDEYLHASVLGMKSRRATTRNSRALRRKLAPAAHAYGDCCARLLKHPTIENFAAFQVVGYHTTLLLDTLMSAAIIKADTPLRSYLERHLMEEKHHEEPGGMTVEDLAELGVDPRNTKAPQQITDLEKLLLDWIDNKHSVTVLGFLQLEHYHPTLEGIELMMMKTKLPRTVFRNLELHALVDAGHSIELDYQIDNLPLEKWHRKLIYQSAVVSIKAVRSSLLDIFKER